MRRKRPQSDAKRRHLVPESYLRRFSFHGRGGLQLRVIALGRRGLRELLPRFACRYLCIEISELHDLLVMIGKKLL